MMNIEIPLRVVLGTRTMKMSDLLKLGRGAIVELDRRVGDPVEIWSGKTLVARGVIRTDGTKLSVEITEKI